MEDAHIAYCNMNNTGVSIFGVFDGHGGKEVALFVKNHFKDELVQLQSYRNKWYRQAREECFFKMDELMLTEEGKAELSQL